MAKGIEKGVEVFTTEGPRHVTWVKTHLYRCAVGQRHVVDDLFGGCWLETCCATRAKDRRILEAPDVTVWVRAKKREETGMKIKEKKQEFYYWMVVHVCSLGSSGRGPPELLRYTAKRTARPKRAFTSALPSSMRIQDTLSHHLPGGTGLPSMKFSGHEYPLPQK